MSTHTTTVTTPAGSFSPVLWMEYQSTTEQASAVHETSTGEVVVVHGPRRRSRASRLALLFDVEVAAKACEQAHLAGGLYSISDPTRPTLGMQYVVTGAVTCSLDPESAALWIVEIDAQEVPA